ncbi:uncharacterized protein LOC133912507 isoform X2 [Phragmites australis]|uniref:uncharacterized protein LOC133912507 isoform X2 n=1 Tax=Phragmites australis TaxID=29695 RepID=UPI002D793B3C|nr:uncharacterized protein LOC133912507 isoform X2 [Phragmites australis]
MALNSPYQEPQKRRYWEWWYSIIRGWKKKLSFLLQSLPLTPTPSPPPISCHSQQPSSLLLQYTLLQRHHSTAAAAAEASLLPQISTRRDAALLASRRLQLATLCRQWSTTARLAAGSAGWGASTTAGGAGSARRAATTSSAAAIATTSPRKTATRSTGTRFNRLSVSFVTPSSRLRRCAATAAFAWGSTSAGRANSSTMMLTRSNTTAKIAGSAVTDLTEIVLSFNRVGGKGNFFHCQKCGSCYSTTLRDKHCCIENSMKNNCPICYEYLFDSLREASVLRCGHTMHLQCFHEMLKHDKFSCPICSTSIFDMDKFLRALEGEMEASYYYMGKGWIVCNDCRDTTQIFSGVAGHKCCHCQSYNTCMVAPPVLP